MCLHIKNKATRTGAQNVRIEEHVVGGTRACECDITFLWHHSVQ